MPSQSVRMADVAAAAGVSRTTASFVLNGREVAIPEETRQRVLRCARQLGYRANRLAQNLARRRSGTIGSTVEFIENPFFATLVGQLERQVEAAGYRVMFEAVEHRAANREQALRQAIEDLLGWSVEGLILYWDEGRPFDVGAVIEGTPTVFMGPTSPGEDADLVGLDLYAGARAAAEHLLALGHRRFCHLGLHGPQPRSRQQATTDALAAAGLPPPLLRHCPGEHPETARQHAQALARLPDRPTAILCHNDLLAVGAYRGLRDAGLRVPEDVSLVGFDDIWAAPYLEVPLTTVALPVREMVERAVAFLLNHFQENAPVAPQRAVLTPRLVVRSSTAPPPADRCGS